MKTKIADKPTTELVELESQLRADINALPDDGGVRTAMKAMGFACQLYNVKKVLKARVEAA